MGEQFPVHQIRPLRANARKINERRQSVYLGVGWTKHHFVMKYAVHWRAHCLAPGALDSLFKLADIPSLWAGEAPVSTAVRYAPSRASRSFAVWLRWHKSDQWWRMKDQRMKDEGWRIRWRIGKRQLGGRGLWFRLTCSLVFALCSLSTEYFGCSQFTYNIFLPPAAQKPKKKNKK